MLLTREQQEFLARTATARAKLESSLAHLRRAHQQAVLDAEATYDEEMQDANRFAYPVGKGEVLLGYAWSALCSRAHHKLSSAVAEADRAFREAAAPYVKAYNDAVAALCDDPGAG